MKRLGLAPAALMLMAACVTAPGAQGMARTPASEPVSLASELNATCTAPQGNELYLIAGCTAGGGSSFVAESMPAPGKLSVRGITFSWPGQSDYYLPGLSGSKQFDSVLNPSAPIALAGRTGYTRIALLVAGIGDHYAAPYTVTYSDGSTVTTPLWIRDWAAPQNESDIPGVRLQQGAQQINLAEGEGAIKLYMLAVDPHKRLASLTVPTSTLTYAISLTNDEPSDHGLTNGPNYVYTPIEARYAAPGPWSVARTRTSTSCDHKGDHCTVYSPQPFGTDPVTHRPTRHPVIVWANGSGVPTSSYDYFLRHLASWGFLVVSSDDTQTGDGSTATDVAHFVIDQARSAGHPWHAHVDTEHIGVSGHSQGGGATMVLFAHQVPPFTAYVAIHPAPSYFCIAACGYRPGDLAHAKRGAILYLQSAGDGGAGDTENYYNQTPDSATKAFGVLANAKHDDVMGNPRCTDSTCITGSYGYLGYSTAWFMWQLRRLAALASVFRSGSGVFVQPDSDWKLALTDVR